MKLIRIRFADGEAKRAALGFLAGRFSFTSYNTGEILVVEDGLAALAVQGISFIVEGPATYVEQFRRFEFLLPTRFNSGELVPSEVFADTLLELEKQFGAVSSESQTIAGRWRHEGHLYRDETIRVFVDVPDLDSNREFFRDFKEHLKERFQQIDIWVTSYPLDVI